MRTRLWALFAALTPLWADAANQSALNPASPQAEGISTLWWAMFYVATIATIGTLAVLALGLWRARKGTAQPLQATGSRNLVLAAGVAIPLVVLVTLVGGSLMLGRNLSAEPPAGALNIDVTGWRWWWEVRYLDDDGRVLFTTANELHVPVGRPVAVTLRAADVIHSFWVPNLHGKTDMIPGHVNRMWFEAEAPGVFRGQCAEYCGHQHALMAFMVVAQPEPDFQNWLANQQQPAIEPQTAEARLGKRVFMRSCSHCHAIRGTEADGELGPDLTHFGSRLTLAAATRPSTRGHISGWIADPQSIKPGNLMPAMGLESDELTAVTTYMESLK